METQKTIKMGQNNIYQYLKKHKNTWFSVRELEKSIQANRSCIRKSLNQLLKDGDVERSERRMPENHVKFYLWKFKK